MAGAVATERPSPVMLDLLKRKYCPSDSRLIRLKSW